MILYYEGALLHPLLESGVLDFGGEDSIPPAALATTFGWAEGEPRKGLNHVYTRCECSITGTCAESQSCDCECHTENHRKPVVFCSEVKAQARTDKHNCPWCGGEALISTAASRVQMACMNKACWATGPMRSTEAEAIAAWGKASRG